MVDLFDADESSGTVPGYAPFPFTAEQLAIINAPDRRVKVRAGAGTGKSRTLRGIAEANPDKKILYVVFNTALRDEAASMFPENVETRTFHSLAYHIALRLFGSKEVANRKIGQPRPLDIAQVFEVEPETAAYALATITAWLGSDDRQIQEHHISKDAELADVDVKLMVEFAKNIWKCMIDKSRVDVRMPPDGYLKLFQLQKTILTHKKSRKPFDIIMFDEYQDGNMCMLDIVKRQPGLLRYVGDRFQSIYAFRGAVDADRYIEFDAEYPLLQSFRFGQPIADQANQLLEYFKPDHKPLVGVGKFQKESKIVNQEKSFAVISRTNAALFDQAEQLLSRNVPYCFVGGIEKYRFDILMNTYYLYADMRDHINDPYIYRFKSFEHLLSVGKATKDFELLFLHKIVDLHGDNIPGLIAEIKGRHVDVLEKDYGTFNGIFFTTGHKCKGLQFLQVFITDDFAELVDAVSEPIHPMDVDPQEINLLYVVMTRAMESLQMPESYLEFLIALMDFDPEHRTLEPQYTYRREEADAPALAPVPVEKPPMIVARPKTQLQESREELEQPGFALVGDTVAPVNHGFENRAAVIAGGQARSVDDRQERQAAVAPNVVQTPPVQQALPRLDTEPVRHEAAGGIGAASSSGSADAKPVQGSRTVIEQALPARHQPVEDDLPAWLNDGPGYDDIGFMTDRDFEADERASAHFGDIAQVAAPNIPAAAGAQSVFDTESEQRAAVASVGLKSQTDAMASITTPNPVSSSDVPRQSPQRTFPSPQPAESRPATAAIMQFKPKPFAKEALGAVVAHLIEWENGQPPAMLFSSDVDDLSVPFELVDGQTGFHRDLVPVGHSD